MELTWSGGWRMSTTAPWNLPLGRGYWELSWVLLLDMTCNIRQKILEICKVINQIYYMCTQDDVPWAAWIFTSWLHPWLISGCTPTEPWPVFICACARSSNNGRHFPARWYGALTMFSIQSWMALVFSFNVESISWNNWSNASRWGPWRELSGLESKSVRRVVWIWGTSGMKWVDRSRSSWGQAFIRERCLDLLGLDGTWQ
jgi:hypothetical protein